MIQADVFVKAAKEKGFALWSGVPCSYLKPFINYVIDAEDVRYVAAANEGDAVSIAAGSTLAGRPAIAMFQNSGLGNAVNPLSSLTYIFKIPVLLITSLRGEPGGPHDEPQHALMGPVTTRMLDLLEVKWEYFPTEESAVLPALERAVSHMELTRLPFAFVMKKDSVAPRKLVSKHVPHPPASTAAGSVRGFLPPEVKRGEMLKAVQAAVRPEDAVFATTGFTGRELYALDDRRDQFYMVGSMGCVSSFGLGVALAKPKKRVIALDGDGAVLMRLGALSTIGYEKPANLVHVVFDNGAYESTGDQATLSRSVDLATVASACGYPRVLELSKPEELAAALAAHRNDGLTFIRVPIHSGVPEGLPRPKTTPEEVSLRMRAFLEE